MGLIAKLKELFKKNKDSNIDTTEPDDIQTTFNEDDIDELGGILDEDLPKNTDDEENL